MQISRSKQRISHDNYIEPHSKCKSLGYGPWKNGEHKHDSNEPIRMISPNEIKERENSRAKHVRAVNEN